MNIRGYVWKISGTSNCYLLRLDEDILIDAGAPEDVPIIKRAIQKISSIDRIKRIYFTHLHYDHIAGLKLFSNATLFASREEISCLHTNPFGTILDRTSATSLIRRKIIPIEKIGGLESIDTPGHTKGSVSYLHEDMLFSGDTLFNGGLIGRTDLPTSCPEKMEESLNTLKKYSSCILCPGHDY